MTAKRNCNKGRHRFNNKKKQEFQKEIDKSSRNRGEKAKTEMIEAFLEVEKKKLKENFNIKYMDLSENEKNNIYKECEKMFYKEINGKGTGSRAKARGKTEKVQDEETIEKICDPWKSHRVELDENGTFDSESAFYYAIVEGDLGQNLRVSLHTGEKVQVRKNFPKKKGGYMPRVRPSDFVFVVDPFDRWGSAIYKYNDEDLNELRTGETQCNVFTQFQNLLRRRLEQLDLDESEIDTGYSGCYSYDSDEFNINDCTSDLDLSSDSDVDIDML